MDFIKIGIKLCFSQLNVPSTMKILLLLLTLNYSLFASEIDAKNISDNSLKKMIGRMLLVGFENQDINASSNIVKLIQKYDLGGVILFDRFYHDRNRVKNISSPQQLKKLTSQLQKFSFKPLLISVDQEGGKVARLKPEYGFVKTPSALTLSKLSLATAKREYTIQANMLKKSGINCNFAPVVDLALNPKNRVIYKLERAYSLNPKIVSNYAEVFIDALQEKHIVSVLKHFPGHGSSLADSHKGFVDISTTWSQKELLPYQMLIDSHKVTMIMTAHVFNSHLDVNYPATLSYNVNTELLRNKMHYKGLIVSDDLQMSAISQHYTLKQTVTLAINAGVDILLFGNQLASYNVDEIVETIFKQVRGGNISYQRVLESNQRIEKMFIKLKL
jgi:beta-N-acetylhexosaminidase